MSNTPAELELAEARVAASTASIVAQGQALKLKVRRLVTSPFVIGGLITAAAAVEPDMASNVVIGDWDTRSIAVMAKITAPLRLRSTSCRGLLGL